MVSQLDIDFCVIFGFRLIIQSVISDLNNQKKAVIMICAAFFVSTTINSISVTLL